MNRNHRYRPNVEHLETREVLSASTTAIAMAISHSVEAYGNFVHEAYNTYLGRSASQSEVSGWVNVMEQGFSDEHLEAAFIGSAEYIQDHGGAGAGWVQGMYQNLLGRTPSPSEVSSWVQALAKGAW